MKLRVIFTLFFLNYMYYNCYIVKVVLNVKKRKNKRRKLKPFIRNVITILIIVIVIFCFAKFIKNDESNIMKKMISNVNNYLTNKNEKLKEYEACLSEEYSEKDLTDNLKNKIDETNSFFSKYSVSIGYEEPVSKFTYKYNENNKYYAASTIKMLDALYIYEKASKGEINLDETMTYQAKYLAGASLKMGKKSYGDKVKLRDLVNYAVIYSDNIAHIMLLDYIGKSTLRDYGKSLGAKYTLNTDNFGEIVVDDALIYLEALNKYLNTNDDNAKELKSFFIKSEQNYLNFPDKNVDAVQKYGEFPGYYHENGIVYVDKPYLVSILTNYNNNEKIIRTLNSKVLELHDTYNQERINRCSKLLV